MFNVQRGLAVKTLFIRIHRISTQKPKIDGSSLYPLPFHR